MTCKITLFKDPFDSITCPVVYRIDNEIYHLNVVGKEEDMGKLLSSFKKGVKFNAKPNYGRSNNIGIKDYDFFVRKDPESGYMNIIFQKKKEADTLYVFDKNDSLISQCHSIATGRLNSSNVDLENVKMKLFNYIYKETGVPVIEEWMEYILISLVAKYKYISSMKNMDYNYKNAFPWLYGFRFKESDIIDIISEGLRNKKITIKGRKDYKTSESIKGIDSLDAYMNSFSDTLAEKIKNKFIPMFTPGTEEYDKKLCKLFEFTEYHAGIKLYEPQKAVIQASVKSLKNKDSVFVVSETGSGKTAMGIDIVLGHAKKENPVITVMAPGHLIPPWEKEIMRFSTFSDVQIIRSLKDFMKIEHKINDKNRKRPLWILFSKDSVKYEYNEQPAVVFHKHYKNRISEPHFACPHCFEKVGDCEHPKNQINFVRKTDNNSFCPHCGSSLWSNITKGKGEWIKVKDIGWLNRKYLEHYEERLKICHEVKAFDNIAYPYKTKIDKLKEFFEAENKEDLIDTRFINTYAASKYIHHRYKNKIDYAIFDEVHQLMGKDSMQSKAFSLIASSAKKSITLTGTLINGYVYGLFYALYRCFSSKMKNDGYQYGDVKRFEKEYGVYETVSTYTLKNYQEGKAAESSKSKILPGINPLVFTEYLMENAVFLSLASLSDNMPNINEIPVGVELEPKLEENYRKIKNSISDTMRDDFEDSAFRFSSAEKALQMLASYPDCFRDNKDFELKNKTIQVEQYNITDKNYLSNKEIRLINLVKEKVAAGEKVLVYTHWSNMTDINDRLKQLLKKEGFRVSVLTQKVDTFDREEWIKNEVDNGLDVLICNPRLIETGLNLLDFTTIIFYQLWRNLFTMRQGSRRSWRLSQSKDVSIYYMYYKDTLQEQIVSLMATKLKAALLAEGKFNEEGLVAMSDSMDILNKLAESVVNDINYSIDEDIFGKQEYRERSNVQTIKQLPVSNCPIHYFNSLRKMKKDKYNFIHEELLQYCI